MTCHRLPPLLDPITGKKVSGRDSASCAAASPDAESRPDTFFSARRRAGYTLLEIVVVCAIMAMIAALTLPSITGMFGDARLEAAGDMIQARMADARSMAMEQGKAYRFGYTAGSGHFQIAPDDSPLWQSSAPQQGAAPIDQLDHLTGELPEGVKFSTEPSSLSGGGSAGGSSWQVGGIFLPDGTAHGGTNPDGTTIDDVTFYYSMAGRAPNGVRLRGLTGTIRLFDPAADEAHLP